MSKTAPTPDEIVAHANEMRGIADTGALICTLAAHQTSAENRDPLVKALSAVPADHKYAHYSLPALRALKHGVPALQQIVSVGEMAAIGFAYQHAKKFCDGHGLRDQMHSLPWADVAFIIRGCFFHDMIVDIPKRNGDVVKWRHVELRRADHQGKPLSRKNTFDSKDVFKLLDDMVASALSGYQQ